MANPGWTTPDSKNQKNPSRVPAPDGTRNETHGPKKISGTRANITAPVKGGACLKAPFEITLATLSANEARTAISSGRTFSTRFNMRSWSFRAFRPRAEETRNAPLRTAPPVPPDP